MAVKEFMRCEAYPAFKAPEVDLVAGRAVAVDSNGVVGYPTDPAAVIGILAQDVIAPNVNTHILSSVRYFARYGENVGVYIGPGDILETDQIAVNVAVGDKLYAVTSGADQGKLTNVIPSGSPKVVAEALTAATAGSFVRIKLL